VEVCRLFNIQGIPVVAGDIPSYIAYNTGSSLPFDNAVAGKGMLTEHAWMNWEISFLRTSLFGTISKTKKE
jgi:NAD(P)H-hydrate repair Nnr-like enzyme with NAD(P)H-hydrate epimerase domain